MKTVNGIISTFILALFITGCMPDSLTKFKETPVQEGSSDGGSDSDSVSTCTSGSDAACTAPTGFDYDSDIFPYVIEGDVGQAITNLNARLYGSVSGTEDYLTYSISPSLDGTGLSIDSTTGTISGTPTAYIASATYTVTLSYTGDPATSYSQTVNISAGSTLTGIEMFDDIGTNVDIFVDDTSSLSVGDQISNNNSNVVGTITAIDSNTNQVSVTLTAEGSYNSGDSVDNSILPSGDPQFIITKATLSKDGVIALATSTAYSFTPTLTSSAGTDPNDPSNAENGEISFYISPTLPTGLTLDSSTGVISGTTGASAVEEKSYSIVAYNSANGKSDTEIFSIKVGTVTAGSSGSMAYNNIVGDKIAVIPTSTTPFVIDATAFTYTDLSTEGGLVADIQYIDTDRMFAEITTAGETLKANFELDNASSYVAAAADVTSAYTIFDKANAISFSPTLDAALQLEDDSSDVTYTISPDTSNFPNGLTFLTKARCVDTSITNQTACVLASNSWVDGVCTNSFAQAACTGGSLSWIQGGTIYGTAQTDLVPTDFTVTAVSAGGTNATTTVSIAVGDTPKDLSVNRQVLLFVNDASTFSIGDQIVSRDNAARGYVTEVDSVSNYLEVSILNGVFVPGVDIDKRYTFGNQVAYITAAETSVLNYNAKITVGGAGFTGQTDITDSTTTPTKSGYIVYQDSTDLYIRVTEGTFSTGDTVVCAAGCSETISAIDSLNLKGTFTNVTGSAVGEDFTDNSNNVAKVNEVSSATELIYTNKKGSFTAANSVIDFENIYAADSSDLSSVSTTATYFFYRGEESTLDFSMSSEEYSDTSFILSGSEPSGFSISSGTLTGTPDSRFSKTSLTLYASNQFGFTSTNFEAKVFDTVDVKFTTEASSYIMHKSGKGNNVEPCRVVEDQLNPAATKTVDCFLDAGEQDLYDRGLKIEVSGGIGLCEYITHSPYFYFSYPSGETDPTAVGVAQHAGDNTCHPFAADSITNQAVSSPPVAADFTTQYTDAASQCSFNHATDSLPDLPLCDSGKVGRETITWARIAFRCEPNAAGFASTDTSVSECLANNGSCDVAPTDNTNATLCVNAGGNWTTNGAHNDASAPANYDAGVAGRAKTDSGAGTDAAVTGNLDDCYISTQTTLTDLDCGGAQYNCLSGAGKEVISESDFDNGTSSYILYSGDGSKLEADYKDSRNLSPRPSGNYRLSNFFGANTALCQTDAYTLNVSKIDETTSTSATDAIVNNFLSGGRAYYRYACKDGAGNDLVEFRLFVRDWDEAFSASNNIDLLQPAALMDSGGFNLFSDIDNNLGADICNGTGGADSENWFGFGGTYAGYPEDI